MSITCQYDQLKYPLFLKEQVSDISLEAKLRLPEYLPRIGMIIGGDFQTGPLAYTIHDDYIVVSGKVYPNLLYVAELPEGRGKQRRFHDQDQDAGENPDENQTLELPQEYGVNWQGEGEVSYEERIEVPGIKPGMQAQLQIKALEGFFDTAGADQVAFRGKMQLTVQAVLNQTAGVISDIHVQAPKTLSLVKERLVTQELLDSKKVTLPVRSNLLLSSIKPGVARVLNAQAIPAGISQEITQGRLYIRGVVEVSLIYVGSDDEGNPTEIFSHDWSRDNGSAVPFEMHMDLDEADGEILALPQVNARNILMEARVPHELNCLMDLDFEVGLFRVHPKDFVVDAIAGEGELVDEQKHLFNLEEYSGEASGDIYLEQQIDLPGRFAGMERVLSCSGTIRELAAEASEGKALLEGSLALQVVYIAEDAQEQKLHIAAWDTSDENRIQLAGILEFPGLQPGTLLINQAMVESLKVEPVSERRLKLSGVIKVRLLSRTPRAIFVVGDCAMVAPVDESSRPSMLFYIVQSDDTLWKIARRYQTTMDTLVKANEIANPENIEVGRKLLIPKKIMM